MKLSHCIRSTSLAVLAVGIIAVAWPTGAEDEMLPAQLAQFGSGISKYYNGTPIQTGQFPGDLVLLRCRSEVRALNDVRQCQRTGHVHALALESVVYPLMPGSEDVRRQIDFAKTMDKPVVVHGKHYPSSGLILVSWVHVPGEPDVPSHEARGQAGTGGAPVVARAAAKDPGME